MKILVPVDGSAPSNRAIEYLIKEIHRYKDGADVHLLNVQHHLPGGGLVGNALSHEQINSYLQSEGATALRSARQRLDAAGVKYDHHIGVGEEAEVIARYAHEHSCDLILIGTRGLGSVANMVLGSVAIKVIHLVTVPVLMVK